MRDSTKALFERFVFVFVIYIICLIFSPAKADEIYFKIGTGYKIMETDHIVRETGEKVYFETGGPLSARIELGVDKGNLTYGISHHSQWLEGWPVNDRQEIQKTELFIDYKFSWGL